MLLLDSCIILQIEISYFNITYRINSGRIIEKSILKAFAWHLEYDKCYNYFALTVQPDGLILRNVIELSPAFLKQLLKLQSKYVS